MLISLFKHSYVDHMVISQFLHLIQSASVCRFMLITRFIQSYDSAIASCSILFIQLELDLENRPMPTMGLISQCLGCRNRFLSSNV